MFQDTTKTPKWEPPQTLDEHLAREKIGTAMDGLSPSGKLKVLREMRDRHKRELSGIEAERADVQNRLGWLREGEAWLESVPLKLEKATASHLHHLVDAVKKDCVVGAGHNKANEAVRLWSAANLPESQTFVIQHDWAAAFKGATDFGDGDFQLPANPAAFEMRLSGKHVIVLIGGENDDEPEIGFFAQMTGGWVGFAPSGSNEFYNDADKTPGWDQIRAMCIALEAEVATTEVVRAPYRLNKARESRGALPVSDYHVVHLAHRSRVKSLGSGSEPGTKKRLHFRRGHWRHYTNSKTWIRWTLVGNPDLGFIDKEYRA